MKENIEKASEILNGVSYADWLKIKSTIDYAFEMKKKERDNKMTLNSDEIKFFIHSRFE